MRGPALSGHRELLVKDSHLGTQKHSDGRIFGAFQTVGKQRRMTVQAIKKAEGNKLNKTECAITIEVAVLIVHSSCRDLY